MTVSLLMIRSQKLLNIDSYLKYIGNCDIAFGEVSDDIREKLESDERIEQIGYIYDYGEVQFSEKSGTMRVGALKDNISQRMFYINPIKGRYPDKAGEICVDRITLKSNGYDDTIGQKIKLFYQDGDTQKEKEFKLVGIVELQIQVLNSGVECVREYPEEMFNPGNVKTINYPFAYITKEEGEELFEATENKVHMLINVTEDSDVTEVYDSYTMLEDGERRTDMHINRNSLFARDKIAYDILGRKEGTSGPSGVDEVVENGEEQEDAYSKYFVPILSLLIGVVMAVGIFDAVRLSIEERKKNYGILLGMGMTGKRILMHIMAEFVVLVLLAIVAGWGMGNLGYKGIQGFLYRCMEISIPDETMLKKDYGFYINIVTKNPYIWSACVLAVATFIGLAGSVKDLFRMTPLGLAVSNIHKKRRRHFSLNLYHILNSYVGRKSWINILVPYIIISVVMAASVFGFSFFKAKTLTNYSYEISNVKETSANGLDYYMKQEGQLISGANQFMHQSGVTPDMFNELVASEQVKSVKGAVIAHSACLVYDKESFEAAILQQQNIYEEAISSELQDRILEKARQKRLQYLGIDTKNQDVFNVPIVATSEEELKSFRGKVVAGKIDIEKLKSGKEVVVAVTDETLASKFEVGDTLPLCDVVRPEDIDNSEEWLQGAVPEEHLKDEPAYSVTLEGVTQEFWCYDTLCKMEVEIGAVVALDVSGVDSFYFDEGAGDYTVNLLTVTDAYASWQLPNVNYTRVGVSLKEEKESADFNKIWTKIMKEAGYVTATDIFEIMRQIETEDRKTMSFFYSIIVLLVIVGAMCVGNSFAMRIYQMRKEQQILQLIGMEKKRICWMYIRRYSKTAFIGMIVSVFPTLIYGKMVNTASLLIDNALENDTYDQLILQKPWVKIPLYRVLEKHFPLTVLLVFLVAILLIVILISLQSGKMVSNMLTDDMSQKE